MEGKNEREVLLELIEAVSQQWENDTPQNIRLEMEKLGLLRDVASLVANTDNGGEFLGQLQEKAPTFVDLYRRVFLRDLKELCQNGAANS